MNRDAQFRKQYKQEYLFKSIGGIVRLRKLIHKDDKDHRLIVLIPGWCESFAMMRPLALALSLEGYNVTVLDYQHLDNSRSINSNFNYLPDSVPKNEYAKALALVNFLKDSHLGSVSIIAHSEGAIIGTLAVYIDQSLFQNLVLANPAGFIKEKNFRSLSVKYVYSLYKQDKRNFGKHLWQQLSFKAEVFGVMLKNPIQSFTDGFAMSNHLIIKQLSEICNNGRVRVDLIFNESDALFLLSELKEAIHGVCEDRVHVMYGGHNELYINMDSFVKEVVDILK